MYFFLLKLTQQHTNQGWRWSKSKENKITNTRQVRDTAVFKRKKKISARFQYYYTRELKNHQLRCLHFHIHIHIRAVNAACVEAPVLVPCQKQNHSFTAMPGARSTDKKTHPSTCRGVKNHPQWTLDTRAENGGVDGIKTWQTATTTMGCKVCDHHQSKHFSVTQHFIKIWRGF